MDKQLLDKVNSDDNLSLDKRFRRYYSNLQTKYSSKIIYRSSINLSLNYWYSSGKIIVGKYLYLFGGEDYVDYYNRNPKTLANRINLETNVIENLPSLPVALALPKLYFDEETGDILIVSGSERWYSSYWTPGYKFFKYNIKTKIYKAMTNVIGEANSSDFAVPFRVGNRNFAKRGTHNATYNSIYEFKNGSWVANNNSISTFNANSAIAIYKNTNDILMAFNTVSTANPPLDGTVTFGKWTQSTNLNTSLITKNLTGITEAINFNSIMYENKNIAVGTNSLVEIDQHKRRIRIIPRANVPALNIIQPDANNSGAKYYDFRGVNIYDNKDAIFSCEGATGVLTNTTLWKIQPEPFDYVLKGETVYFSGECQMSNGQIIPPFEKTIVEEEGEIWCNEDLLHFGWVRHCN